MYSCAPPLRLQQGAATESIPALQLIFLYATRLQILTCCLRASMVSLRCCSFWLPPSTATANLALPYTQPAQHLKTLPEGPCMHDERHSRCRAHSHDRSRYKERPVQLQFLADKDQA